MTDTLRKKLGAEIRRTREARDMRLEDLGDAIDRDKALISRVERYGKELTIENLEKISKALDVDAWQLVAAAEGAVFHDFIELNKALTKLGEPAIRFLTLVMDMRLEGKIDDGYLESLADVISLKSRGSRTDVKSRGSVKRGRLREQ